MTLTEVCELMDKKIGYIYRYYDSEQLHGRVMLILTCDVMGNLKPVWFNGENFLGLNLQDARSKSWQYSTELNLEGVEVKNENH